MEYSADLHAAELYGSKSMIEALLYVERDSLCGSKGTYYSLQQIEDDMPVDRTEILSTHPNTINRIKRLRKNNLKGKFEIKKSFLFF